MAFPTHRLHRGMVNMYTISTELVKERSEQRRAVTPCAACVQGMTRQSKITQGSHTSLPRC